MLLNITFYYYYYLCKENVVDKKGFTKVNKIKLLWLIKDINFKKRKVFVFD